MLSPNPGFLTAFACISTIVASVIGAVGWTTLQSAETCHGGMHQFIYAVTITSTAQIAIFGMGTVLGLLSICIEEVGPVAVGYNTFFMVICSLIGSFLNMAWLIWGIVVLSNQECEDTIYHTVSIVLVVLSGLSMISNACQSRQA